MNEVALSNDLNVITAEINSYKQVAGQAIFEIGKRLKHVKENDLVHGEFGKWLESMDIDRSFATRSMKVATELSDSNYATWNKLSSRALYEIATMPEQEREQHHTIPSTGETKTVDEMTVRELREVKRQLKQEQQARQQAEQDNEKLGQLLTEERNKKTIEREVYPDDYDLLKGSYSSLEKTKDFYKEQNDELKKALKKKENNSNKGDDFTDSYNRLSQLKEVSSEFIRLINLVKQADDLKKIDFQEDIIYELENVADNTEWWSKELRTYLKNKNIIEGVFTNEN